MNLMYPLIDLIACIKYQTESITHLGFQKYDLAMRISHQIKHLQRICNAIYYFHKFRNFLKRKMKLEHEYLEIRNLLIPSLRK